MIDIDVTMLIQIANVFILIVIMNAVLYKPIRSILEQRQKRLAALESEIASFNKNARLQVQEFDAKLNGARRNAKATLDEVRAVAQGEVQEKLAAIRKEAEASKAEQLQKINTEFAAARQELGGQIDIFAKAMAEKVLGRSL